MNNFVGPADAVLSGPDSTQQDPDTEALHELVARQVADLSAPERWTKRDTDMWAHFSPPGHADRDQGWKIHVSATPRSAAEVLTRSARVLVAHRCAFKIARDVERVDQLVASTVDRGTGGKILTAYPTSDTAFRPLIQSLHEATDGLDGPSIMSDLPYAPGSLVHYRFGGFAPRQILTTEGTYEYILTAPDGTQVPDLRKPWFNPPEWAPLPIDSGWTHRTDEARGKPVLINGRYLIKEAIRLSFKGGVFRAVDQNDGTTVIVKQARPFAGADSHGNDARDWMRHEAEMLQRFSSTGLTPVFRELFEYQGDQFLVEEELDGKSLRHWVAWAASRSGTEVPAGDAARMALDLCRLMSTFHDQGFVLRDFNPGNIVVVDDQPRLVDLEFVAAKGDHVRNVMTPGYTAPEQVGLPRWGLAYGPAADAWSLGATLMHLATRIDPVLAPDEGGEVRSTQDRYAALWRASANLGAAAQQLMPIIEGLMQGDVSRRSTLAEAEAALLNLTDDQEVADSHTKGLLPPPRIDERTQNRLLQDGLAYTTSSMSLHSQHLWPPVTGEGRVSDECNVQSGAGGIVHMLTTALRAGYDECEQPLRDAIGWLRSSLGRSSTRTLPGLYFGRSGTAWALYEAGRALGDDRCAADAVEFATRVPLRWPNPDVTHGLAGAGTAMLHLWRRTGDAAFRTRAEACCDGVLERMQRANDGVSWPVPADFDSRMAGITHLGYAHGVAGIGNYLLTAGTLLDRPELVEIAVAGGKTLASSAMDRGEATLWPTGEPGTDATGLVWWCSGSAGVGKFLLRLGLATGDTQLLDLAHRAAVAVRNERWSLSPTGCHGNAGSGDFLLDMADRLPDGPYRIWAEEIAHVIELRARLIDGRLLIPGDDMQTLDMGFNSGMAGALSFLFRLRHGGPAAWMVELPERGCAVLSQSGETR